MSHPVSRVIVIDWDDALVRDDGEPIAWLNLLERTHKFTALQVLEEVPLHAWLIALKFYELWEYRCIDESRALPLLEWNQNEIFVVEFLMLSDSLQNFALENGTVVIDVNEAVLVSKITISLLRVCGWVN